MRRHEEVTQRSSRPVRDTKDIVLKAAIDEFAEYGLAGGRVDRIAKRAGVNKQVLYYHYGDKEALFSAALVFGYTQFAFTSTNWTHDDRSPAELMRQIIGDVFDLVSVNRNHIALIADENRNRGKHLTPEVVEHVRKATNSTISAVETVLRRGQKAGSFSRAIEPKSLYAMVVGIPIFYFNHAFTLSCILREDTLSPDRIAELRSHYLDFVMAALRPDRPLKSR